MWALERDHLSAVYELVVSKTQIHPMAHLTSLFQAPYPASGPCSAVPTAWNTVSHILAELACSTSSFRPQIHHRLLRDAFPDPLIGSASGVCPTGSHASMGPQVPLSSAD